MAIRVPSPADGRDPLLVAGVLPVLLGLIAAGAVLVGPDPLPEQAAAGSYPPTRTVLLTPVASPLTTADRRGRAAACHPGPSHAARPGTQVLASSDDDPGQFLSKMAALRHRRRIATSIALDPYQASLNPAVYLARDATPRADDGSPTRVAHGLLCRSP